MAFDPTLSARLIADAHAARAPYANLTGAAAPPTIEDAYAAQEALVPLWTPTLGPVRGLKIATTTKVMQALMGIDHPCGGMIYQKRIFQSGSVIALADYVHLVLECELAVQLKTDLPDIGRDYTRAEVRQAVGEVMAAFELIEDRNAVYKETDARTLIADNAWNGGIVVGPDVQVGADRELNGIHATAMVNGKPKSEGLTDDPMGALAWVANLAVRRSRPMTAGMVVITGSIVATFPVTLGDTVAFEIDNIGRVDLTIG